MSNPGLIVEEDDGRSAPASRRIRAENFWCVPLPQP